MNKNEFEEVVQPIAATIDVMEYFFLKTDKSNVSTVLKSLSTKYPIPEEHKHLKRVDRSKEDPEELHVLICEKNESLSISTIADQLLYSLDQIGCTTVPRFPAFNKDHFLQGRSLWPITYHPQTPPPLLSDEEKVLYTNTMKRAIELGQEASKQGNAPIGMVILDSEGRIVGESGDNRNSMFLDHCCFAGIRNRSINMKKESSYKRPSKEDPYLCTNCDVIITREPCVMCCMCLLHSRVRRVIYGSDDPNGGFNHSIHIHYNSKLNHHFRVFRNCLKEDCDELWRSRSCNYNNQYV